MANIKENQGKNITPKTVKKTNRVVNFKNTDESGKKMTFKEFSKKFWSFDYTDRRTFVEEGHFIKNSNLSMSDYVAMATSIFSTTQTVNGEFVQNTFMAHYACVLYIMKTILDVQFDDDDSNTDIYNIYNDTVQFCNDNSADILIEIVDDMIEDYKYNNLSLDARMKQIIPIVESALSGINVPEVDDVAVAKTVVSELVNSVKKNER